MMAENGQSLLAAASAAASIPNNLIAWVPKIKEIIASCKEKAVGVLQPAVDEIVAICLAADLAYKKHILGRHCGVHPKTVQKPGSACSMPNA